MFLHVSCYICRCLCSTLLKAWKKLQFNDRLAVLYNQFNQIYLCIYKLISKFILMMYIYCNTSLTFYALYINPICFIEHWGVKCIKYELLCRNQASKQRNFSTNEYLIQNLNKNASCINIGKNFKTVFNFSIMNKLVERLK